MNARKSPYDMTRQEFTAMVTAHIRNSHQMPTEFSSWAANLNLAMRFANEYDDRSFISIIDTRLISRQCKIWYGPDLHLCLDTPLAPGEWLIHGVIEGEGLDCLAYRNFTDRKIRYVDLQSTVLAPNYKPITKDFVRKCQEIAAKYATGFQVPMVLALLAQFRAQSKDAVNLFDAQSQIKIIEDGLQGLQIQTRWYDDPSVMQDIVPDTGHRYAREVKIFIEYLRHFARLQSQHEEAELQRQIAQAAKAEEAQRRQNKADAAVKKSNRQKAILKELVIDMNRQGFGMNNGSTENEVIDKVRSKLRSGEYSLRGFLQKFKDGEVSLDEVLELISNEGTKKADAEDVEMKDAY